MAKGMKKMDKAGGGPSEYQEGSGGTKSFWASHQNHETQPTCATDEATGKFTGGGGMVGPGSATVKNQQ